MMKYLLIVKKMKKIIKNISYLLLVGFLISACQSVKDGLTGTTRTNTDEFLIEKKNPLILPPDFSKLPEPNKTIIESKNQKEIDVQKILSNAKMTKKTIIKNSNKTLEKSILEKIKSN